MKIGLDLDNTILESKLFEMTFREFGKRFVHAIDWPMSNFPKDIRDVIWKRFNSNYFMCHEDVVFPIKNSIDKLKEWKKQKHELIIITARNKEIRMETRKMINKLFPMITKMYFVSCGEKKENVFKRLKLDVWIDDNPVDVMSALDLGIDIYMISNEKTLYNHHLRKNKEIKWFKSIEKINF
jgi:uncharacterized HAD superfamily protein